MPESADALPCCFAEGIYFDVINDIVRPQRVAANAAHAQQMIQGKDVPYAPADHMIRARGITAHSDAADQLFAESVKCKSATEHVDAPILFPTIGSFIVP